MSDELASIQSLVALYTHPPVQSWRPALTRSIDIHILRNGDWLYQGSKIHRKRMVTLFSSVLRIDEDGHTYLVTPHERLRLTVEDAPFTAVLLERHGKPVSGSLVFTTNVGEQIIANQDHPVIVEYRCAGGQPSPYLLVRDRLRALISRTVFLQLASYAEEYDGRTGVYSEGVFMPLMDGLAGE